MVKRNLATLPPFAGGISDRRSRSPRTKAEPGCARPRLKPVEERRKTGRDRFVLLNDRALRAIQFAREYAARRSHGKRAVTETPFVFPPSENGEYVRQASDLHKQRVPVLNEMGDQTSPPVQLPPHLCDNMLNVRPQSRIYCPTAGSQRSNAAVDVCPLAQLKLRLERAGKTQDWYQIGIS